MSKTSLAAILAASGIAFLGTVTPDAVAFATALQRQNVDALIEFTAMYPSSPYAAPAFELVAKRSKRGSGNNGDGNGNTGPGNPGSGNNNGRGNAGYGGAG